MSRLVAGSGIARISHRGRFAAALGAVLLFTLYWYGAFLSFPLLGEDAANLLSTLLETIKDGHLATLSFPIKWLEGLGQPNPFVTFTFDPFAWPMLLPLDPADAFRLSMALRATAAWLASYWFVIVLFRGQQAVAMASATLYLLIDFVLTSAWGIPTFAGIYNATHAAVFPLLPTLALLVMRAKRRVAWADLGLLAVLLLFLLDYPVGSLIGTAVFLVFAGAVFALARPAERRTARWGLAKIAAITALLLLGPPLYLLLSWLAVMGDSAREVFTGELFSYGNHYQPPFMWTAAPRALRLCILIGLLVVLFSRRWPRSLRMAAAPLILVVGGVQLTTVASSIGMDAGLIGGLPRLHYLEFYLPLFYATCGGFALCHWQELLQPNLDDRARALSWAARTVVLLALSLVILPLSAVFIAAYGLLMAFALLRGEPADSGRVRSERLRRRLSLALVLAVVGLAVAAWLPPTAAIHPVFYRYARCQSGILWCRDPMGATMAAADNPITQFLRGELSRGEQFAGRAETLVRPPARLSLTVMQPVKWTPELFLRLHGWYERAYDAQIIKDPSPANPLRVPPQQVTWFGPGDSRDYLLDALVHFAHGDGPYLGPMQEALILEMQSWLAANGLGMGIAAAPVTEGWDTSSEIEALGDERTNAFFMTGNGLVQRALPFQDVPIASSYDQSLGFLYELLWTRYLSAGVKATKSINVTSLEALHPERLALLGVRYLVARDSQVYERPPLERVTGWQGYSIYALGDANLSGYGVGEIEFANTLAEELRAMRSRGFEPQRTAVLPARARAALGSFAAQRPAALAESALRLAPDELVFSARSSGGQSLVVLPFNWSNCWRPEWRRGSGSVLRADVGLMGVVFVGEIELHLRWTAGYGSARACLGEDGRLVAQAQEAAAEVDFAKAYEPYDERSPPYAVKAPRFPRVDDLVGERELARRGDLEAVVPAYVAKLYAMDERSGGILSSVVASDFRRGPDGYVFSARNDGGTSLMVLPLRYSECWKAEWLEGRGELVPVDVSWLGVLFRNSIAVRLALPAEDDQSACARRDRVRQTVLSRLDELPGSTAGGRYSLGDTIRFASGGNVENYTTAGWSGPEPWGRWSIGKTAQLVLRVAPPASGDLELEAMLGAFLYGDRQSVTATVAVNGTAVGEWHFSRDDQPGTRRAIVPRELVSGTGVMVVEFTVDNPASPLSLGMSTDNRLLALSFQTLTVRAAGGS